MTEDEAHQMKCCGPVNCGHFNDTPYPARWCDTSACMAWRWLKLPRKAIAGRGRGWNFSETVDVLEIGTRAINLLRQMDLKTVGDIRDTSDATFLRTPNCGRRTLCELRFATDGKPAQKAIIGIGYCGLAGRPK